MRASSFFSSRPGLRSMLRRYLDLPKLRMRALADTRPAKEQHLSELPVYQLFVLVGREGDIPERKLIRLSSGDSSDEAWPARSYRVTQRLRHPVAVARGGVREAAWCRLPRCGSSFRRAPSQRNEQTPAVVLRPRLFRRIRHRLCGTISSEPRRYPPCLRDREHPPPLSVLRRGRRGPRRRP